MATSSTIRTRCPGSIWPTKVGCPSIRVTASAPVCDTWFDWEMPKNTSTPNSRPNRKHVLLALVKLQHRYDQITRIGDLPRFEDLSDHAQSGILIGMLGGMIVWMCFEFSYSRLDRDVREPVPGRVENHRVVCSNFFLSASAFALSASSSSCVRNRMSGNRISSSFGNSRAVGSIKLSETTIQVGWLQAGVVTGAPIILFSRFLSVLEFRPFANIVLKLTRRRSRWQKQQWPHLMPR